MRITWLSFIYYGWFRDGRLSTLLSKGMDRPPHWTPYPSECSECTPKVGARSGNAVDRIAAVASK